MSHVEEPTVASNRHNVIPLRPAGAEEWFADLFKQHSLSVQRYVYRRTEQSAVEDLTAETFATAWRKRDDIPVGMEIQWLYKTAGFLVANHNRKKSAVLLENFPEIVHDEDPALVVVEDITLRRAFAGLSEKDRKVIVLAAWEGQSAEGIAVVLGISTNAAAVALSRARARFSKAYSEELEGVPAQANVSNDKPRL